MDFFKEFIDVFNHIDDEILITDASARVIAVTPSCRKVYGLEPSEVIGKTIKEMELSGVHSPSATPIVLEQKKRITILQETQFNKKIVVTSSPVFNKRGEISRVVSVCKDVTDIINGLRSNPSIGPRTNHEELSPNHMVINCQAMREIEQIIDKIAYVDCNVLIVGETGTGKGIIAKEIHKRSNRKQGMFVHINCSAIPENLLESELFGYDSGAFTGANKQGKIGLFEMANDGYLFLDEIGDMSLNLQAKLLYAIESKEIIHLGGSKPIKVNCRIIASTNRDLEECVFVGTFRRDLFYRLNTVYISIPPLRDRYDDIGPLVKYYVGLHNKKYKKNISLTKDAMKTLLEYHWPGNVRELSSIIERLIIFSFQDVIESEDVIKCISPIQYFSGPGSRIYLKGLMPIKEATEEIEKQLLIMAKKQYGSTSKMAYALKVDQATVYRKLKKYELL